MQGQDLYRPISFQSLLMMTVLVLILLGARAHRAAA